MQTLREIHQAIRTVAAELGRDPRELSREELIANSSVTFHDLRTFGGLNKIRKDVANCAGIEPQINATQARGVELRNQYVAGLERKASTQDYLIERLDSALVRAFEHAPVRVSGLRKNWDRILRTPTRRELVAVISDTHFGLCVDPREVPGNAFNWTIAARRLGMVVEQCSSWKPEHRAETDLVLCVIGDLIQGAIHSISEGQVTLLTEQVAGATHLLVQAIDQLRHHFRRIRVVFSPGNHDRMLHRGDGRSTSAKWDSFATMIALGVQYAFRSADDVSFDVPRTPYVTFELAGTWTAFASHGDGVLTSGNVGKSVNVERISTRVYALNASLALPSPADVVILGHVHVPLLTQLQNGTQLIINGTLSGTDAYAQSIGIHANNPTQVLFEATPEHAVGDFRILRLRCADTQTRFDEIVRAPSLELDEVA